MKFGGGMFAGDVFAGVTGAEGVVVYGTGFITDYARVPGSTITDRSNAAGGFVSDAPSVSGTSFVTDRTSP